MPDYQENLEKDVQPSTSKPVRPPTATPPTHMNEDSIRLIATATQGVTNQMLVTNTNLTRLNNRLDHLVNTISRKHEDPKPQDPNIGLKHLMGDVRAEMKVMNQVLSQHTSETHQLNKSIKEFTGAVKSQTAQMEILYNANIASQNTFSQCLIALTEKISGHQAPLSREDQTQSDRPANTPTRTEPHRRPNTYRGFHPRYRGSFHSYRPYRPRK